MKIFVIRHGQTELNKKGIINGHIDDVLAPEGIEQAKNAAPFLPKTIKHIYSSSLARAKETAKILNETLNVPVTFHDELREVNFGILNGTPFLDEHKKRHKMLNYDWRPSGESFEEVKTRVLKFLEKIKENDGDEEALLVAHGGIIRLLHFLEFGKPLDEIENTSLHGFDLDKILK
ncbi:MAG: putative phosphoglycerate mutase [Parcubacteria group bacterium Gr01-1014_20]|nr:MAG: putative phosphoglycerate mutase [Parcubacteria group bacterium Gr01-1014_20]